MMMAMMSLMTELHKLIVSIFS